MGASPLEVLLYFMLSVSTYLFSTCTGAFISLSIPTGVSQTIRSIVQVLFVYFGLAPTVFIIALGFALDLFTLFTVIAIVFNFILSAFFALVTPAMLVNGRK